MSTRYNDGSHYENHPRAAELRDEPEHAHRVAEQEHGKQDHLTGHEQSRQAMEHAHNPQPHGDHEHAIHTFGHAEIAALAHELWIARGRPEGSPEEDWYRAAKELRSRNSRPAPE